MLYDSFVSTACLLIRFQLHFDTTSTMNEEEYAIDVEEHSLTSDFVVKVIFI